MKKLIQSTSITRQLAIWLLILSLLAISALFATSWLIKDIQGAAYSINQLGTLRMNSYKALSMVPLQEGVVLPLTRFEQPDPRTTEIITHFKLQSDYRNLYQQWKQLVPQLYQASSITQIAPKIDQFVTHIDQFIRQLDQKTDQRLMHITLLQTLFIIIILISSSVLIVYLYKVLYKPSKRLVDLAKRINTHDFSHRFNVQRNDEIGIIGHAFNHLCTELSLTYTELEQRIADKTAQLKEKNRMMTFLYHSIKQLHTKKPLCERLLTILTELETYVPLRHFQVQLHEPNDCEKIFHYRYELVQRHEHCQKKSCGICLKKSRTYTGLQLNQPFYWPLNDEKQSYGVLSAYGEEQTKLTTVHTQLLDMLTEQLVIILALDQHQEYKNQLLIMQERSAIARELHDSLAQSLSYMKIQVSCLQMQKQTIPQETQEGLQNVRQELNVAYSQLRELLKTFRLQLGNVGLYASLLATKAEFEEKLHFPIHLDYQLPPQLVRSHQAIHLIQIVREALNNVLKYAKATQVRIRVAAKASKIELTVMDNGIGFDTNKLHTGHYGLMIIKDRAKSLSGESEVVSSLHQGCVVKISFIPE